MKKRYLALLPVLLLTSCTSGERDLELSVASPNGAPAISLYNHLGDKNVEISNAQTATSYFQSGAKDVVILPTNAGVKMIQKQNAPFKLAATVTFGNFFLASTGNDENKTLDKTDYVVVFQQNAIPDQLFKFVYGSDFSNVHYVTDVNAASRCLISGKNESDSNAVVDYVLVAQPALAASLKQNQSASVHSNLQSLYKDKTGGKEITQASIFINNSVDHTKAKSFLNTIKNEVTDLLKKPSLLDQAMKRSGLEEEIITQKISNPQMVKTLIENGNQIGIGFKSAYENKASIDAFLATLGQEASTDEVYFR